MKKILSLVLALAMVLSLCSFASAEGFDGEIKIWVAEATVEFTKAQVEAFKAANPEYANMTVTIQPVGEGDAASNMLTDVEAGADLYVFAQDQLARLVAAGALIELSDENAKLVAENTEPIYTTRCSLGYTFASFFGSPTAGFLASVMVWTSVFTFSSVVLWIMGAICFIA